MNSGVPRLSLADSWAVRVPLGDAAYAVPVREDQGGAPALPAGLGGLIPDAQRLLRESGASARPGKVSAIGAGDPPRRLLLAGIGSGSFAELRRAGAATGKACRDRPELVSLLAAGRGADALQAVAESTVLGAYSYRERPRRLAALHLVVDSPPALQAALERGRVAAQATWLARRLADTPSLEKSPDWLADTAATLGRAAGLRVRVRGERELAEGGFGGLLAVGAGSARPPRLVELGYAPERPPGRHVALIGKGITFDSGGMSLKPPESMTMMKTDMAGAAAVLAATVAAPDAGVPHRVTTLLAVAENLPSGTALRPGDVIRHYGGRTVEVLNTDAEGRLVLADALAYAAERLAPDAMVDLATLTGAATLGLGRGHAALYATDDRLAANLLAAGAEGGEPLWRMPLVDDYRDALDSDLADLRNIAEPARRYGAGSIVAALFLREFSGGLPWAHLDIAGPARAESDTAERAKGATGFGARLLLYWLAAAG